MTKLIVLLTALIVLILIPFFAPTYAKPRPAGIIEIHETYYYSRSCPNSHWYVDHVNDEGVTVACEYAEDER